MKANAVLCLSLVLLAVCSSGIRAQPPKESVEELLAVLKNPDKSKATKYEALLALQKYGAKAEPALPVLQEMMKSTDLDMQMATVGCLRAIGKAAVPTLASSWKGKHTNVRRAIGAALMGIGPDAKAAIPALLEWAASGEKEPDLPVRALNAIGPEPKDYIPVASAIIKKQIQDHGDSRSAGSIAAMEGFAKMGPAAKDAVPVLTAVLEQELKASPGYDPVMACIRALAAIGPDAAPALPALRKFLDSSSFGKEAERAIEKIKAEKDR